MMQGRQKIKDIIAALTDVNDPSSLKKLQKTLKTLLDQQFLRTSQLVESHASRRTRQ